MKKIFQIHLLLEQDLKEALEREATDRNLSLSELCRQKLRETSQFTRIELLLEKLLNTKQNSGRRSPEFCD